MIKGYMILLLYEDIVTLLAGGQVSIEFLMVVKKDLKALDTGSATWENIYYLLPGIILPI